MPNLELWAPGSDLIDPVTGKVYTVVSNTMHRVPRSSENGTPPDSPELTVITTVLKEIF